MQGGGGVPGAGRCKGCDALEMHVSSAAGPAGTARLHLGPHTTRPSPLFFLPAVAEWQKANPAFAVMHWEREELSDCDADQA